MEVGGKRISQNCHKNRASPYALSKNHTLSITHKKINLSPERFCFWYSYKLSDHQNYTRWIINYIVHSTKHPQIQVPDIIIPR